MSNSRSFSAFQEKEHGFLRSLHRIKKNLTMRGEVARGVNPRTSQSCGLTNLPPWGSNGWEDLNNTKIESALSDLSQQHYQPTALAYIKKAL